MVREYKDSGITWIGSIPKEWKTERIKALFSERNERDCQGKTLLSVSQYFGIRPKSETDLADSHIAESYDDYKEVRKGDFVMNIMFAWNGSYAVSDYDGIVSPAYCVFKFRKDCCKKYFHYLLRTDGYPSAFKTMSRGVIDSRLRLYPEQFYTFPVIIPSVDEQQRIADYLDKKCAEIDGLIELQEQMIAQLTDYKQSVITEAVTKGLNPNATLVPSDVDWIEHIPLGWEIKPFKEIFRTGKGLSFTKADLVNEGVPVISYGQVHSKQNSGTRIDDELIRFVPNEITNGGDTSKVYVGDFIFADTSEDLDGCGNCVYVDKEIGLYAGYHSVVAHSKRKKSNLYLAYLFLTNCWRSQIRCRVSGIKVFSISQSIIKQATIILPPVEEQIAIATYLNKKCTEIDNLIAAKQQKIEMLKKKKKSLIFECVTGKKEIN